MRDHCCHPDCECRLTEFYFDRQGAAAVAKERGVARPVEFRIRTPRPRKRWWQVWRKPHEWDGVGGEALHWSSLPGGPVNHHIITLVSADVQAFLRVLLHEIEHCIQSESFDSLKDWNRAYNAHPQDYEAAADAAGAEWEDYGFLIEREAPC